MSAWPVSEGPGHGPGNKGEHQWSSQGLSMSTLSLSASSVIVTGNTKRVELDIG